MANTKMPLARLALALTLAALGGACTPTAIPLPMLTTGHGPAHLSAQHASGAGPSHAR